MPSTASSCRPSGTSQRVSSSPRRRPVAFRSSAPRSAASRSTSRPRRARCSSAPATPRDLRASMIEVRRAAAGARVDDADHLPTWREHATRVLDAYAEAGADATTVGGLPMTRPAVRVLHVAQPTDYGVARYVGDLVAGQVAAGWDVSVACPPDGSLPAAITERGARHVPWSARRGPGPHVPGEIARLRRIVD